MKAPALLIAAAAAAALLAAPAAAASQRRMDEFSRRVKTYEITQPKALFAQSRSAADHGLSSRTSRRDQHGHALHRPAAQYRIEAFGHTIELDLVRNDQLISADYVEERVAPDGTVTSSTRGAELCYYVGTVRVDGRPAAPGARAAVSTCRGLHGLLRLSHSEELFIEPASGRLRGETPRSGRHVIYRTSDVEVESAYEDEALSTCSVSHDHALDVGPTDYPEVTEEMRAAMAGRQHAAENFVESSLVNDYTRFQDYGAQTEESTLTIFNMVTEMYSLALFDPIVRNILIRQRTFDSGNQFTVVSNAETLLDNWCAYRRSSYNFGDNGVFLSGIDFQGSTIGLAWVGTMCTTQNSCNVNQESAFDHITSATIAHEQGHNLNLPHDSTDNARSCPQSGFIMAAVACNSCTENEWSSCSKNLISSFFDSRGNSQLSCLHNVPETGWSPPECGNGVVEEGEECDSDSSCCNNSCELVNGAVCDPDTSECCSDQCIFDTGRPCGDQGRCYGDEGKCMEYDQICVDAFSGFAVDEVAGCASGNGNNVGGCGYLHCYVSDFSGSCTNLQYVTAPGLDKFAPDGTPCSGGYCENNNCVEYDDTAVPCPVANGRTCNGEGTCSDGECSCTGGWSGSDCSNPPPCPEFEGVECNDKGPCNEGVCACEGGWSGDACQFVPQCPKVAGVDCNGQGQCVSGICQCEAAWGGDACDIPNCPGSPDCSDRGTCSISAQGQPVCVCESNWKGVQCETPDCPGEPDCNNNGRCNQAIFFFDAYCTCDDGFTGNDCGTAVTQSPRPGSDPTNPPPPATESDLPIRCDVPDCNGHGNCIVSGNSATCSCFSTWKGDDCDISDCPGEPDCASQGVCTRAGEAFDPVCECESGWRGSDCSLISCPENPLCETGTDDSTETPEPTPIGTAGVPRKLVVTVQPAAGTVLAENSFIDPNIKVRIVDFANQLVTSSTHSIGVLPADDSRDLGIDILGGGSRPAVDGEVTFNLLSVAGPRGASFKLKFYAIGLPILEEAETVVMQIEPCAEGTATLPANAQVCACDFGFGGTSGFDCQPCPIGTYKNNVDNVLCEQCPPLTSTPTTQSTSRFDCACREFPGADPSECTFVYQPVGPEGDTWTFPGLDVTIPTNAIDTPVNISVVHINGQEIEYPSALRLVSNVRRFGPSGAQFENPVEVLFDVFADEVTDWEQVKVFASSDGSAEWEEMDSTVDVDSSTCLGLMPHFTYAAAFEIVDSLDNDDDDDGGSEFPTMLVIYGASGVVGAVAIAGCATFAVKKHRANRYKAFNDFSMSNMS